MIRPSSYIALPLAVAVVEQWSDVQPDRLTVAMAEASLLGRVMPFAARDMHQVRPDLWILIRDTYKRLGGSRLVLAQYRRPRAPCWSLALVPPEDGPRRA
jgi:hypothetical protein